MVNREWIGWEGQGIIKMDRPGINFQSESKKSGDEFEDLVLADLKWRGFVIINRNVYIPGSGCEVDFLAEKGICYGWPYWLKEYIEAKGGKEGDGKRPGAQRTDNVKKAIANAALIKTVIPDARYVVYFSAKPLTNSSSAEMIEAALCNNIIDEVRYLKAETETKEDLTLF